MTIKSKVFSSIAVLIALVAFFAAKSPVFTRHWLLQLTYGKLPFLKAYDSNCDSVPIQDHKKSSRFSTDAHCFNSTGEFFWHDAQHNETRMRELLTDAVDKRCPILIYRPFNDNQCLQRVRDLAEKDESLTVRVKQNEDRFMLEASEPFPKKTLVDAALNIKGSQQSLKSLLAEYDEGYSQKFTAFDVTLNPKTYEHIWGVDMTFLQGRVGTTFFSNYNRTILTTPFHSAFSESFGYQCAGTKNWDMLTPDDALPTVQYHSHVTAMKNCNGRADIAANIIKTRSDPDTLFYFPPFWAHAVETEKGLSVLLNYRSFRLGQFFKKDFMLGILVLTGFMNNVFFFSKWNANEVAVYFFDGRVPNLTGAKEKSDATGFFGRLREFYDKFLDE